MDEPYLGEIRPISISYAPKGWAFCNGQSLSVNQNAALFSLLGTTFGGNGSTTFNLPDLRGRVAVGVGQLAGGSSYPQGQQSGSPSVALASGQIPAHQHGFSAALQACNDATETSPANMLPAVGSLSEFSTGPANTTMGGTIMGNTSSVGSGQPHDNQQPYLALNFVIALQGIYPTRN